jgi:hypothetical protein
MNFVKLHFISIAKMHNAQRVRFWKEVPTQGGAQRHLLSESHHSQGDI